MNKCNKELIEYTLLLLDLCNKYKICTTEPWGY